MKNLNLKEKTIIITACILTTGISAGFTITQGETKSNTKDYTPINTTNQNQHDNKDSEIKTETIKNEKETIIKKYIPIEKEVEGLPKEYNVLAVEEFDEKTRISIQIPKSDKPELVLGQVKSIGQKVKEEYIEQGKDLGNLEIKAYYNEENNYWSYNSSNKNIIIHNQVIPNA